jgi:hypothetical protein
MQCLQLEVVKRSNREPGVWKTLEEIADTKTKSIDHGRFRLRHAVI